MIEKCSIFVLTAMLMFLTGCGGGSNPPPSRPPVSKVTLGGGAYLAAILNAKIAFYPVDVDAKRGIEIASTETDVFGEYTINLSIKSGPLLVCASQSGNNARYIEESTGKTVTFLDQEMCAVFNHVEGELLNPYITGFSHLAWAEVKYLVRKGMPIEVAIDKANADFGENLLGMSLFTKPLDPTDSINKGVSVSPGHIFGILNAALSEFSRNISLANQEKIVHYQFNTLNIINLLHQSLEYNGIIDQNGVDSNFLRYGTVSIDIEDLRKTLAINTLKVLANPRTSTHLVVNDLLDTVSKINSSTHPRYNNVASAPLEDINNQTVVTDIFPAPNSFVRGTVPLSFYVKGSEIAAISYVEIQVGSLIFRTPDPDPTIPVTAKINTTALGMNDGLLPIKLRVMNAANTLSEIDVNYTLDNTNPTGNILQPITGEWVSGDYTASFSASDANFSEAIVTLQNKSGVVIFTNTYTVASNQITSTIFSNTYPDGKYVWRVDLYDLAGNMTSLSNVPIDIDNNPPSFTRIQPQLVYYTGTIPIQYDYSDAFPGSISVYYDVIDVAHRITGGGNSTLPVQTITTPIPPGTIPDGPHTMFVVISDDHYETIDSFDLILDTTAPLLTAVVVSTSSSTCTEIVPKYRCSIRIAASDPDTGIASLLVNGAVGTSTNFFINDDSCDDGNGINVGRFPLNIVATNKAGLQTTLPKTVSMKVDPDSCVIQ